MKRRVIELYDQWNIPILSYLRSLGLSESDADDVLQETFLRLMNHLLEGRPEGNLRGWLYQVAYSQAMDIYRFDRRFSSLPEDPEEGSPWQRTLQHNSPSVEDVLIQNESLERVEAALTCLPSQQRRCVQLRSEGLRYREIATNLGVSTQRVAMLVGRGVTRLSERL